MISLNLELRKEWEQRINDYKASGQSQAEWCEDNWISYNQFGYWGKLLIKQWNSHPNGTNAKTSDFR